MAAAGYCQNQSFRLVLRQGVAENIKYIFSERLVAAFGILVQSGKVANSLAAGHSCGLHEMQGHVTMAITGGLVHI